MTDLASRVYETSQIDHPQTPKHIRERLHYHQQEGHTDVRLFNYADRGYVIETYRDLGRETICHRYFVEQDQPTATPRGSP
jgi:hypothetical protein